jgi:hypothetical protein
VTAVRKTARRRAKPAAESVVYNGRELCGTITPKGGMFAARLASGKSLGRFAKEDEAQRALTAAARVRTDTAPPVSEQLGHAHHR